MRDHQRILELAAAGQLPALLSEHDDLPFDIVKELVDAGMITAKNASTFGSRAFHSPNISLAGREYLEELQRRNTNQPADLERDLDRLRDLMVAVSTGGPRIEDVNDEYRALRSRIAERLASFGIEDSVPFADLWEWYGRWRSGDLPSYQSRRQFVAELLNPIRGQIRDVAAGKRPAPVAPTGWPKVDRALGEIRRRLGEAQNEEQFQAVGLLCREVLISLAQAVYDPEQHPTVDDVHPSATDAKRMFDAYIAKTVPGPENEVTRKHARAAYDLAVELQHRRTATFRQAALCAEATSSVVNAIAILSGRRDP